jgi:hypothetical protein
MDEKLEARCIGGPLIRALALEGGCGANCIDNVGASHRTSGPRLHVAIGGVGQVSLGAAGSATVAQAFVHSALLLSVLNLLQVGNNRLLTAVLSCLDKVGDCDCEQDADDQDHDHDFDEGKAFVLAIHFGRLFNKPCHEPATRGFHYGRRGPLAYVRVKKIA